MCIRDSLEGARRLQAAGADLLTIADCPIAVSYTHLSKGNREKVQLILAMSRNARLYLLDEPIGGVDPAARD